MRNDDPQAPQGAKLPTMRRKAVSVTPSDLVDSGFLGGEPCLPLVLRPNAEVDLAAWVQVSRDQVEQELATYGAILFRGFGIDSVAGFGRVVQSFTADLLDYVEGSSPRTMLSDKVYTSTEYPPEYAISLHNELSYAHKWPGRLFFCCLQAAEKGGETPIADGRRVLRMLPPGLLERFERGGIRYLRRMHGTHGAGLSWGTVFETTDRAAIESYCREGGIDFEWTRDGGLRTSQVRPATVRHPRTGERVWFNQADQWHPSNLGEDLSRAMTSLVDEGDLPLNATYGDGPIATADLDRVREVIREAAVTFPWQAGDVLLIDNTMALHGRMPFTGRRRVLLSMGDTVHLRDVR